MQWFITILIGLLSGAVGSLIAPWVHWKIEKRQFQFEYKRNLIHEWRQFIEQFNWESESFGNSTVYGAMRPHMREEVINRYEAQRTFHVPPDGGRGENLFKQWASDEIARIESKWELL